MKKTLLAFLILFLMTCNSHAVQVPDLNQLTTPADQDIIYIIDASDTTDRAEGTGKYIVVSDLLVDAVIPDGITITNAATADALSADGANCSSGNAPLGVNASGAVQSCFDVWTEAENTSAAYIANVVEDTTPQLGGALDGQGNDLNSLGVVFLTEQADAEADVAGKGQWWVNTATPNEPYFTDDAGNDRALIWSGGAFHDGFSDYVANEHIDHTSVTLTAGAGLSGGGDISASRSFATASGEADFLASGALTCGASTQGKVQVHTTPLQYCDNTATPTLRYAAYGNSSGNATSATTDTIDAITEIASGLKSGADAKLITGTAGGSGNCAEFNADGDLVEAASAAPCGSGGSGDNVSVNSTGADTTANFLDNEYIDFTLTDGGAGGPDDISAVFNYAETLAGNPALAVDECIFMKDTSGGGILCEGSTADTNEQLYRFPDVNGSDTTEYFVIADDANVSSTEAGYLDGVTSSIQNQIDGKEGTLSNEAGLYSALSDVTDFVQGGEANSIDSDMYVDGSIDSEHMSSNFVTGLTAVGTFESGDTFICNEAGVGIRECDFDDLPSASGAFSDSGDPIVPNTTTKDVALGAAHINTSKLSIDGDADQVQFTIQCDGTQTDSCAIIENSGGTEVINLEKDGDIKSQSIQDIDGPGTNWKITSAGAITAASYGGITEANLVDKTASETVTGDWTFNTGTVSLDGTVNIGASDIQFDGTTPKKRVYLSATAGICRTTAGCTDPTQTETTTNKINYFPAVFADDADDFIQWEFTLPENYDGSTFTFAYEWVPDSDTTSGGVSVFLQCMSISDDDALDAAFGTAVEVADDWTAAGDFLRSAESAAVTCSGSPAGGDKVWFQLYRDVDDADDDLAGGTNDNFNLIGIYLTFGIDQLSTED